MTNLSPGEYNYSVGMVVTVNATPNANYDLDHWSLDGVPAGTANPISVTMNANHSLQAVFTPIYTLNITVTAGGTTNPTPGTYICFQGTLVNVTASNATGYYLDHWELDGANVGGVNPIQVTMNANHTLHAIFLIHDVAVTNFTSAKTVIGQGYCGNLTVTAQNQGNFTETFNVTVYANTTSIASQNVTLLSGKNTTVTLTWNTTGFAKGNYTLNAYAWPVQGETNTGDNNFTDGWVIVAMVGDLSSLKNPGIPDGKVDINDLHLVAINFGKIDP